MNVRVVFRSPVTGERTITEVYSLARFRHILNHEALLHAETGVYPVTSDRILAWARTDDPVTIF